MPPARRSLEAPARHVALAWGALLLASGAGAAPTFAPTVACSPGQRLNTTLGHCEDCPSGTYANNLACIACGPGTFSSKARATECTACPPGKVSSPASGMVFCEDCAAGEYAAASKTLCVACELGRCVDMS